MGLMASAPLFTGLGDKPVLEHRQRLAFEVDVLALDNTGAVELGQQLTVASVDKLDAALVGGLLDALAQAVVAIARHGGFTVGAAGVIAVLRAGAGACAPAYAGQAVVRVVVIAPAVAVGVELGAAVAVGISGVDPAALAFQAVASGLVAIITHAVVADQAGAVAVRVQGVVVVAFGLTVELTWLELGVGLMAIARAENQARSSGSDAAAVPA